MRFVVEVEPDGTAEVLRGECPLRKSCNFKFVNKSAEIGAKLFDIGEFCTEYELCASPVGNITVFYISQVLYILWK